jgi:DNA-binding NtrC family response regulator
MATARRVAQTDATVLICGESGTGKELISSTIHDIGPRCDKPYVVVDCASIPTTLIESELFGHERGAYTGAQERKKGRLKEADGGTLLLDEIGEMPLEVQGRLLRFVQEKQLKPVGGNRVEKVDVRVLAATNRDLEEEVREGRFREDLFHRLNVIRLDVPPLRERPIDIKALADLFLRQFAAQYKRGKQCRLSHGAETRLLQYSWPGNVRELRNRIMQAVILSANEQIGPEQLGLVEGAAPQVQAPPESRPADPAIEGGIDLPAGLSGSLGPEELWDALRSALAKTVGAALEAGSGALPPLNRWLAEDLVIKAYDAAGQVLTRGADILGIPEATFRRKLHKAQENDYNGLAGRSQAWTAVDPLLSELVGPARPAGEDLLKRARTLLLAEVLGSIADNKAAGAALMGVTGPTFRRWVRDLELSSAPEREHEPALPG